MKKILIGMAAALILSSCGNDVISDPMDDDKENVSDAIYNVNDFINSNLIAYYPLNSKSNNLLGSLNGEETDNIYATDRFGLREGALNCSSTSYVDIADNGAFDFNSDYSISFWMKSSSSDYHIDYQTHIDIISKYTIAPLSRSYYVGITSNGGMEAWSYNNNATFLGHEGGYHDNLWHHVTYTYKMDGKIGKMYVDGDIVKQGTMNLPASKGTILRIGGSPDSHNAFGGLVDDVMIFNSELKPNVVTLLASVK